MERKENVKKLSKFVYSTKMGRATCFEKGVEWADKHPRNGLFNVDGACDWLMDNLPTYSEMTPLTIKCFVGAFKNFCEQKTKVIAG